MKYNFNVAAIALVLSFLVSSMAHAHGENMPGPHKGKIRMPGPYHTEVIAHSEGYQVYLLDMNFENPTVKESSVVAVLKYEGKESEVKCQQHPDHFFCPVPKALNRGSLVLKTTRENAKGNEAVYKLPL